MASGTISLGTSGAIMGQIVWSSSSNGIAANSSQVTASIQVRKTSNTTQSTTGTWTGNLNINGDNRTFSTRKEVSKNAWVVLSSFTITKSHNADGTATCYIQGKIQGPAGTSQASSIVQGNKTVTLDKIPRQATITSAFDFSDTQNPTINYTNPAGNSVTSLQACISLTGSNPDVAYRDIPKTGSSYTFNLTEAERNVLRRATPNSNTLSVYFYVKTVINGSTFYSNINKNMTIVNANPTFSSNYKDTNSTTISITGNDQQIIQNNSNLQINISNMTALKYATLRNISANVNGNIISQNISSGQTTATLNIGQVNASSNIQVPITLTDSRGNKTINNINITILNWSLPSAIITLERVSNYYTQTNINVNADYSSLNGRNTISIKYQIKKLSDSSYGALNTLQDNITSQFNADNLFEWNVRVIVADRIGTTTYNLKLSKGIPIAFFDNILSAVGFNCFPRSEESVWSQDFPVDDVIYLGSQTLYDNYQMTTSGKQNLLGSYNYDLVQGLFVGITIPSAYEMAYRITAQIHTADSNQASVGLNNFNSNNANTWSLNTMRKLVSTRIFKESEIELESVYNYSSRQGTNLYVKNSTNAQANFWNITCHAYLVKKTTNLADVGSYDLTPADDDIENS